MKRIFGHLGALNVLVLLIAGYCLIAGVSWKRGEVFPFFHWSLFSQAYAIHTDHSVRVIAINHEKLPEPTYVGQKKSQISAGLGYFHLKIMTKWGLAVDAGLSDVEARHRQNFERVFAAHTQVEYELVERRYDTIEYWKTGALLNEKVLGHYTYVASH